MLRIRITLPKQTFARYRHLDLLHDALINAWVTAGASPEDVIGTNARPWNFAALGKHQEKEKEKENIAHSLIVTTPDATLAQQLRHFDPQTIRYTRASTSESVDFAAADITVEIDPILPGQKAFGVLMLSPLAVRNQTTRQWYKDLDELDLSAAINHRLSRLAERKIQLQVRPDSLYLRCHPEHAVLVPLKQMPDKKLAYVIGMQAPLVLMGNEADLRFAWYAGLGEKTRNGFGCVGLVEERIGREKI